MNATVFLEHGLQLVLVHRFRHLAHKHFNEIRIGFLAGCTDCLSRTAQVVVVVQKAVVVVQNLAVCEAVIVVVAAAVVVIIVAVRGAESTANRK